MESEIKFRDYPVLGWLVGLGLIGYAAFAWFNYPMPEFFLNVALTLAAGALLLGLNYALTITADRNARTLTLDYRSPVHHTVKELRFDEIASIRVDSRVSRSRRRGRSTTYCVVAELKNGEKVPFRSYYSGGSFGKQKIADGLREFIGLAASFDETPQGILRAAPKIGAEIAQARQASMGTSEPRVTAGVNWQMQSVGIGAAPAMRWFSADFKTQGGFLLLAQKVAGQSSTGFMAALGSMLFKQAISLYGFSAADTPNLNQAQPYAGLSATLDDHFMAYTSDPQEARQILNPWAQNPLAQWGARHPLKQFQSAAGYSQIIVLFSPNGVYIATATMLNPDEVEEVAALGVELVKAQGTQG